ncbi:hypothetical protein FHT76_008329 [Rhizobium sp. BK176]|nr:hypothetical protein [Rhizobium sp. BK399]MCS3740196.1 hypothetical protein [Rhizobium sp. BK661]MCS4096607.1 hypothetical protein [Rhizobium sp. BK176]
MTKGAELAVIGAVRQPDMPNITRMIDSIRSAPHAPTQRTPSPGAVETALADRGRGIRELQTAGGTLERWLRKLISRCLIGAGANGAPA